MSRRTLTVLIDGLLIDDGAMVPPRIGSIVAVVLEFTETFEPSREAMTVDGVLDLDPTPGFERALDSSDEHRYWTGDLYGDGWRASWRGDRPRSGPVTLTGRLCHWYRLSYNPDSVVRGRVARMQVVSIPYHAPAGDRWELMPGEPHRYRDVEVAPRRFDKQALLFGSPEVDVIIHGEIGLLVELDLDVQER
ncbi:hypothetical protein ACPXCG_12570 [Gordonia sp. DT218]|uniref:hypothetical protein n=1 Tax=Gordonia sp. DT218 TaxID=3416659 RepID=UPI003CFB39B3